MAPPGHIPVPPSILDVRDLHCRRGGNDVLRGVDLTIPPGGILAVLGANGAGKTTLINVLSTLIPFTSGSVTVAGRDLATDAAGVRSSISLTGQFAAVDNDLTGMENLVFFGRLAGLSGRAARDRAVELLDEFNLRDAADKRLSDYSGGMRRRLDIAVSLVVPPALLFLDEPSTGLDPESREALWSQILDLRNHGTSILLTTQYLEEADRLADRVAVLRDGRIIAVDTPRNLKSEYGRYRCSVTFQDHASATTAGELLADHGYTTRDDDLAVRDGGVVELLVRGGFTELNPLLQAIDRAGLSITDVGMTPPSLDDVYFALARADGDPASDSDGGRR
ncbi:ATP-binding cassette domain-containing protein [Corynebacterium pygosceleis]|uniref:ATP-binding cassette domain-containing protein n=1 Tax=Corynebacterium pygosceleis TaxID=2800406 RepID=A0A9Q4GJV6_9CORY|nr:ATP-binding cassette domain-containing protein [Corynebacterium pygosceleis]MCK7637828.1 ATP-binding cassette domain-containing protein [Corynebacterium pygosceleis]MCK7675542.1 ATP-binding cassette domain-containing protein [Corynebacterium pygosceleis]MCL0121064.1 ATP-binding cassette domain-containing protein [Corynebacterium pygosceleis]MCX7444632.1 ATP-binding cassette domain-containing protein [Corynebacterium pygosceleis]MCX7468544.1 ATP-binding cassette domain-containing protein [Co